MNFTCASDFSLFWTRPRVPKFWPYVKPGWQPGNTGWHVFPPVSRRVYGAAKSFPISAGASAPNENGSPLSTGRAGANRRPRPFLWTLGGTHDRTRPSPSRRRPLADCRLRLRQNDSRDVDDFRALLAGFRAQAQENEAARILGPAIGLRGAAGVGPVVPVPPRSTFRCLSHALP